MRSALKKAGVLGLMLYSPSTAAENSLTLYIKNAQT